MSNRKKYFHHRYQFISTKGKEITGQFVAFHAYDLVDDNDLVMEKLKQDSGHEVYELVRYSIYGER